MSITLSNARKILVVHGVNSGDADDVVGHIRLRNAMANYTQPKCDYSIELVNYESINDLIFKKYSIFQNDFVKSLLAERTVSYAIDVVGDVFNYLKHGPLAKIIKARIKDAIMNNFENDGDPLVLVAHSLGSLYAFDVLGEIMQENPMLFNPNDKTTWPVQSFVTLGSPMGLVFFSDRRLYPVKPGEHRMRWLNFFDREDPFVTGNVFERFGQSTQFCRIAERYQMYGWFIDDVSVDNGSSEWLPAHTNYWENPVMLDAIISLLESP